MSKKLCEKNETKREKIRNKAAKFQCKKCEETAPKKKHLCKPGKIIS